MQPSDKDIFASICKSSHFKKMFCLKLLSHGVKDITGWCAGKDEMKMFKLTLMKVSYSH